MTPEEALAEVVLLGDEPTPQELELGRQVAALHDEQELDP